MTDTSRDDAASNERKKEDNSDNDQNTADRSLSNTDNAGREIYPRPVSPSFDGMSFLDSYVTMVQTSFYWLKLLNTKFAQQ